MENNTYEIVSNKIQVEPEAIENVSNEEEVKAPETEEIAQTTNESEQTQPREKSRAQKRIEKLSQKTHELERKIAELTISKSNRDRIDEVKPENFEDYDSYLAELDNVKQKSETKKENYNDFPIVLESLQDKFDESRELHSDFDEKIGDTTLPLTEQMLRVINESDESGEVVYYLANNPKEAKRISLLSPLKIAVEIGKIESKLTNKNTAVVVPQKTTKAPEPINPLGGKNGSQKSIYDAQEFGEYEAMRNTQAQRKTGWV